MKSVPGPARASDPSRGLGLPARTAATVLLFVAGCLVPYAVPDLARLRILRPGDTGRFLPGKGEVIVRLEPPPAAPVEEAPAPALPAGETPGPRVAEPPRRPRPAGAEAVPAGTVRIEDAFAAMDAFYGQLDRTSRREPGAVCRISHFGDSPLTGDLISGEARKRLQATFGDGGPGFVLPGRPWGWYQRQGVTLKDSGWRVFSPVLTSGNRGRYGLSGVCFWTAGQKGRSEIATATATFSRLEVTYTIRPGGGRFLLSVDGGEPVVVATEAARWGTGSFSLEVGDGPHAVSLRPKGDGEVTIYGVVLERDGPGLVYDALGANGASIHALTLFDGEGWAEDLSLRRSDLVILNYGTNESGYAGIPGPRYEREIADVVARVRRALPGASVLLMAPMDRGTRAEDGSIVTMPSIPKIVDAQRAAAAANGCAFFDTFRAMGGGGTMARWYESEPRLVTGDFTHTTKTGSDRVARLLVEALESGFAAWKEGRRPPAPEQVKPAAASSGSAGALSRSAGERPPS